MVTPVAACGKQEREQEDESANPRGHVFYNTDKRPSSGRPPYTLRQSSSFVAHCSLAYSALACLKIGTSGSASFHSVRKS
jgi:hypothetical protein